MKKEIADKIIEKHLKNIYGFTIKKCKNLQDAEDLSQDIALRAYRALILRDEIENESKFIFTIAHNCLCNYYRKSNVSLCGVPVDAYADSIADDFSDLSDDMIMQETINKLHSEIAYLSKLQRKIVIAYYYENKKQSDIAKELGIPVGTVKWHLFEAKKELKKGIETVRNSGELKFNPIKFSSIGYNGTSVNGCDILNSALVQNILYCVWKEGKDAKQIADELGVSPVYIESEAQRLLEYSYLTENNGKYLCNILLDIPNDEIVKYSDEMYETAAKIFANELYDELIGSDILQDCDIAGGYPESFAFSDTIQKDINFFLWALMPYIASVSGRELIDRKISFEKAATYRVDGSRNICFATILEPKFDIPKYTDNMNTFYGPCQSFNNNYVLWQIDSKYSGRRINTLDNQHILFLLDKEREATLTKEEYAYLCERGYLSTSGKTDELFKSAFRCVYLNSGEIRDRLISIGDRIKEKHWQEFEALKAPYANAVRKNTPKQLLKMQEYGLQFTFFGDAAFIAHCLDELAANGKLTALTQEQKKAMHTIIMRKDEG